MEARIPSIRICVYNLRNWMKLFAPAIDISMINSILGCRITILCGPGQ